ncbi:MAG: endonuclease/exonuclease/phosphatase family protein [Bdellovibrionia bacterium]
MLWKIPEKELWTLGSGEKVLLSQDEHKLLIWNIYKANRAGIAQDLKKLTEGSEFIFLQEALQQNRNNWLEALAGFQLHLVNNFESRLNQQITGVGLASTTPSHSQQILRTQEREFGGFFTPKSALFSVYKIEDQAVLFVSVHVLNFVTQKAFIKNIEEIVQKVDSFKGPVIVAGDFNTWSQGRWQVLNDIMKILHLIWVPIENDNRLLKLDHAFVRGFDVTHSKIENGTKTSDHFPLVMSVRLEK